jgi:hypothetical protein
MKSAKITIKLVRQFSVGFSIFSPTLNGFYAEIYLACFSLSLWSRGKSWIAARNYWG